MTLSASANAARAWLDEVIDGWKSLAFPPTCVYSGEPIESGRLSSPSRQLLTVDANEPMCLRCGVRIGPNIPPSKDGCDLCRTESFAFEGVVRLGRYRDELASAVLRLKSLSGHALATALANLLAEHRADAIRAFRPNAVVPIPLHWWTRWRRSYNQAEVIAEELARRLELPCRSHLLRRIRMTRPQHHLSPTERRGNVRRAFAARRVRSLQGLRIVLVDDVMTTGATCHHAAQALRKAGADAVLVAVVARAGDRV